MLSQDPPLAPEPVAIAPDLATALKRIADLERINSELQARSDEDAIRYRFACELGRRILWTAAPNGDVLDLSPLWTTMTGLSLEDSLGTGWVAAIHPEDLPPLIAVWQRARATGEAVEADYRLIMLNGDLRWFHARAAPWKEPDGTVLCWYGTTEDIHDQKTAEKALMDSEASSRRMLGSTTDFVCAVDRDWRLTFMNQHFAEFVCENRNGKIGDSLWDLFPDYRGSDFERRYQEAISTGMPVRFEAYLSDIKRWADFNACPTSDGLTIFIRDSTDARRASEALFEQAHRDELTGLANRTRFNEALEEAFDQRVEKPASILLLDLDLFKEVNDTLGHPVGDKLLRAVARRFQSTLDEGDLLARLGGDEFAVIHRPSANGRGVQALADRFMASFNNCFFIDNLAIKLAASIGTADSSPAHTSANDLFRAADIALYRAKEDGRGSICAFDDGMADRLQSRQTMKSDLEVALVLDELRLVYQPLFDIASGRISGAEALLRWRHPTKGEVSPGEFIPLAEETGLIVEIGDWVLRRACREATSWPDEQTVAVNLSPVQIRDETLPHRVLLALAGAGLHPSRLELEITESVLLHDSERNLAILHTLREAGVRIALDDFGTGYSSLSYLRHFPFDKLKLDRCFVGDIGLSPQSEAIIRAAGEMGRAMSMTTTAEGVETAEQLAWLRANGWSQAQGWHTGRPMEATAIQALFAKNEPHRPAHPTKAFHARPIALAG